MNLRGISRIALMALLAAEGFLLLRPEGVLVHAARGRRRSESEQAESWFRQSPVHMGCSIASCKRPATRTASYHVRGTRGNVWRAYGFCDKHAPPAQAAGLIYRPGRPATFDYDVPLTPIWSEVYFLLGTLALGLWCAGMWRLASTRSTLTRLGLLAVHASVIAFFWRY